jgi:hypothetical protein
MRWRISLDRGLLARIVCRSLIEDTVGDCSVSVIVDLAGLIFQAAEALFGAPLTRRLSL